MFDNNNLYVLNKKDRNALVYRDSMGTISRLTTDTSPDELEHILYDFRRALKKLREESDDLAAFKKLGRAALPPELQITFDSLWTACASIGIFIVRVGELESWLIDYDIASTSNKSKWISSALNKVFNIEYDENKEVWKFVDELKAFLRS